VWAITRYIGDPGHFAGKGPATLIGRYIDTIIGILKILIFAVPAGLVANGFRKAMEDDKRKRQLTVFSERLRKAFRRKQCRYTRYKVVPRYVSVVDIEAMQRMTTKDILDTVDFSKDFRLRNLASTQSLSEHPQDRLIVEHFSLEGQTSYGCKIDRGSNVTIVSTSSVSEAGIGNFSYYLAQFGGFNYISKEFEQNPDEPRSYYIVGDEHGEPQLEDFLNDLKELTRGEDKWAVMMLSASGADEPLHPTQFHFVHQVQKKLEIQPTTAIQEEKFIQMYQLLSQMLEEEFQLNSDLDELYLPVGKKNIAMQIGGGKECNAFTLRTAFSVTEWDDRYIAIVRRIAEIINLQIGTGKAIEEDKAWKENAMGF
jgi:voltage-gated potassium channel